MTWKLQTVRGFQAAATESATLARLRWGLPLVCLCLATAGLAGASTSSLAALPAVPLLHGLLRSMNPAGETLSWDPVRGWVLDAANAGASPCRVEALGQFRHCLALRICPVETPHRARLRLFFEDSLSCRDWRRLRRAIRLWETGA